MPKYVFEARATNGKDFRGEVEATNEAEARVKIRAQRMVPMRVVPATVPKAKGQGLKFGMSSVKAKDLQILTRQLATLLSSGIPIMQSIDTLGQSSRSPVLGNALKMISNDISQGKRLGDALAEHPGVFNRFYVNMVKAGEESGNLDQILARLAGYIEKSVKIQGKVKGALAYPLVIMVIAALVVSALLIFVIPKFQTLFSQMGGEIPALTKFVIDLSDFVVAWWWAIALGLGASIFGLIQWYATTEGRRTCDTIFIDLPLLGDLVQKSAVARFTRTMSTLLGSGVSIMEAMDISSKTVGNYVIERAILRARDSITEGKSLTVPLLKEKYMPNMVVQMIGIGEQTGTLDQMLAKIADFYEDEVDVAVGAMTSIIEPLMMVVLGGIIAFLVIAMYLPIFNLAGMATGG